MQIEVSHKKTCCVFVYSVWGMYSKWTNRLSLNKEWTTHDMLFGKAQGAFFAPIKVSLALRVRCDSVVSCITTLSSRM